MNGCVLPFGKFTLLGVSPGFARKRSATLWDVMPQGLEVPPGSHPEEPQAQAICHPHDPNFQVLRAAAGRVFQGIRTSFTRFAAKSFKLHHSAPAVKGLFANSFSGLLRLNARTKTTSTQPSRP